MVEIVGVTPHIPSLNPGVTRDFFVDLMGFQVQSESERYIELRKGTLTLGIQRSTGEGEPNQQSFYIRVSGIDEFWEAKRDSLSNYKLRDLFVQDYGMKEFHVVAPETRTLVFVGEPAESES